MMIKSILILTVLAALVPTAMSSVSASSESEIALFSTASSDSNGLTISGNGDSAKMELKATNENGKSNRVSGFQLTANNVLSIEVGDKVTVEDNVDFTKAVVTDARNNQKAIGITSNGMIDFAGYNQGVYTIDVVVDDDRAYEAIIAIGDQTNQVVDKEITRVNNDYTLKFIIDYDCDKGYHYENGKCVPDKPKPIKCPKGEELIDGKCQKIPDICQGLDPCPYYPPPEEPEPPKNTGCNDGREPVDGICPYEPGGVYCQALGCPGSPPASDNLVFPVADPMPKEPEPEPIECGEGEESVDGQCQLITTNPVEPIDPLLIDENSDDQSIIDDDDSDESEDDGQGEESGGSDSGGSEESEEEEQAEDSDESEREEQSSGN